MAWTHLYDADDSLASNKVAQIGVKSAPTGTTSVSSALTLATGVTLPAAGTMLIGCTPAHSYTGVSYETYVRLNANSGNETFIRYDGFSSLQRIMGYARFGFGTARSPAQPTNTYTGEGPPLTNPHTIAIAWDSSGASMGVDGVVYTVAGNPGSPSGTGTLAVCPLNDFAAALAVKMVALANHRVNDTDLATLTSSPNSTFYSSGSTPLSASANWQTAASAALTTRAAFFSSATVQVIASASFTTQAALAVSGQCALSASATLTTRAALVASGEYAAAGSASLTTQAALATSAGWDVAGSAALTTQAALSVSADWAYAGAAEITQPSIGDSGLAAAAVAGWEGAAALTTRASFSASAEWGYAASAALTGATQTYPPSKSYALQPTALMLQPIELTLQPVELKF